MARRPSYRQSQKPTRTWPQWFADLFTDARVAIFAIALAFVAFNHLGWINWVLDILGRGLIAEANSAYLHKTKLHMGESILVLTGLDTAFEVLKSSSAGISFIVDVEVQVGNIVATLQDLTNKALMASLIAAGSLIGIELVLKLAEILAVPVLSLTILVLAIHYTARSHWRWLANISGQVSELLVLMTLLIHLGMPLIIYGSSLASAALTTPIAQEAHTAFTKTHVDFATAKKGKISSHVKAVINRYKATSDDTHRKSRSLSGSVVRHIIAILFDAFLFPALMLLAVLWGSRIVIRHTLKIEELIKSTDPGTLGTKSVSLHRMRRRK